MKKHSFLLIDYIMAKELSEKVHILSKKTRLNCALKRLNFIRTMVKFSLIANLLLETLKFRTVPS